MKLFLDRGEEQARLTRFLARPGGGLAVVYGRRRCGKSTLLQRVLPGRSVYFQGDQRESALHLEALAKAIGGLVPAFDRSAYLTWDDLLAALHARADAGLCVFLDEFPYLVQAAPELPSVLQRQVDRPDSPVKWVLCGSSQRMMQGLVLERSAPLYGRAEEILKVEPLRAGWLPQALGGDATQAVRNYSVWGGVPRYWELAARYADMDSALADLAWDRLGVLHDEPMRLLLDELRGAAQPYSILSLIGSGCHRASEIAARLGKPMSSLARPLAQLCELGYVRRDLPYGESSRNSKRSLYRLDDPFLRFFFRFVLPFESSLAQGVTSEARHAWDESRQHHVAACWEDLCRSAVPWSASLGGNWGAASSWWHGSGASGEVDIVALSTDGQAVLLGGCKWAESRERYDVSAMRARLIAKAAAIPVAQGRRVLTCCCVGGGARTTGRADYLLGPDEVMAALRR